MKIAYYPGCTLKTKSKNLEVPGIAAMAELGVELEELERWNCCGVTFSLADDDLIHVVAPVRDLVRVKESGHDKVVTMCSMCYNTLAQANHLMRTDEEKRKTINTFMSLPPFSWIARTRHPCPQTRKDMIALPGTTSLLGFEVSSSKTKKKPPCYRWLLAFRRRFLIRR